MHKDNILEHKTNYIVDSGYEAYKTHKKKMRRLYYNA